jgi:CRP-like cAMP-binding protein
MCVFIMYVIYLTFSPPPPSPPISRLSLSKVFLVGDTIIQQGEIGQEMFFLVRGLISIEKMVFDEKTNEYGNVEIAKLKAGSYFGELSLLRKGGRSKQRRAASCISLTNADTRILRKDIFHEVCEDFPELRTYLQAEADRKYAKFSKPSEEKKEEKKEEVQKSPERIKKLNSIIAALSQKNVEIVASPNSVQNVIGKKGEAWGLPTPTMTSIQTALDSINLRMSRLEINMSRLQAKGSGVSNDNSVIPLPSKLKSYGSRGRNYITSPNASDKKGPKEPPKSKGWARIRKIVQPTPTTPREILTSLIVEENDNEDNKNNDSETNGRRKKRDGRRTPSSTNSSGRLSSPRNLSNSRWGSQPSEDEETRRREQEERQKKLSNRRW